MTYLKSIVSKSIPAQAPHKPAQAPWSIWAHVGAGKQARTSPWGHLGSCGRENAHSNLIQSSNMF